MSNARRDERDMDSLLDAFQEQMLAIAEAQQERTKLTGTATSRDKTVTVTVNANGVVIETKFAAGIADLSYAQIAKTVTKVAQDAAAEVARKNRELAAPITDRRARLPKLSDLIDGMPDFVSEIPVEPPVSLAPPGSPERSEGDEDTAAMRFTDVEEFDHGEREDRPGRVTDSSW
ncbi:YbaB/EbfC family nucleoid-associated protein [Nocardia sp. NBC_00508]|uniref:YbaB/EbfC family nucleoid-associated protein n=1 Tax=Nocardia sp. NBC_00508 TaxID=2975992 RepID=UPI002E7FF083|nr:YbaB/EbfC family nucleoid-associated protein [Nocardia sp. NBC_00508]WUD68655.1 YbaB/EbfC family nucleoid-associated protein [Nocardia sp. NBC_00508]